MFLFKIKITKANIKKTDLMNSNLDSIWIII